VHIVTGNRPPPTRQTSVVHGRVYHTAATTHQRAPSIIVQPTYIPPSTTTALLHIVQSRRGGGILLKSRHTTKLLAVPKFPATEESCNGNGCGYTHGPPWRWPRSEILSQFNNFFTKPKKLALKQPVLDLVDRALTTAHCLRQRRTTLLVKRTTSREIQSSRHRLGRRESHAPPARAFISLWHIRFKVLSLSSAGHHAWNQCRL
jgi:hypothetical protein